MNIAVFGLKLQGNIPNGPVDIKSAIVKIMSMCQTGDKQLSEPMMA